jgi:glycosyltransferase involved in cell wall biosynthesis
MSDSVRNGTELRNVHITFVLPSIGLGGAERQAFFLARYLRETEQADARLLSLSPRAALAERCDQAAIPYGFFEVKHAYRSRVGQATDVLRFIRRLRRERVDILLPYCMFQNILCGLTWRASGVGLCIWNQRDEGRSRVESWVERMAVRLTPHFISNSTHGADFLTGVLHAPASRVHVVNNGVEMPPLERAAVDWRAKLDLPPGAFVAAMVANLHSKKDHKTLIAAWRPVVDAVAAHGRSAQLLLAGAFGDSYDALREQVASLGLTNHVRFLGQVQDVAGLLKAIDLALFSSYTEGVPNSVLEAMAHGLAVVGTDFAGIREAVGDEAATTLLAPPRDAAALADRIVVAATDAALREHFGRQGKLRVSERFGVDRMAAEMTAIIASAWRSHSLRGLR